MIRLVLADDHAILRSGLKQIFALAPDLEVASEASNGTEVLACLDQPFDLLLLDLNMEGISGADLIARVKAQRPELPILVLSMHNDAHVAGRMIKAGAGGYITKGCEPDVLLMAIRVLAAGGRYITPELAERMVFNGGASAQGAAHKLLSERELEIFRLLIMGKKVSEIALQLAISDKTVSTHKTRLMEKLQLTNMADLMRYAMQNNLSG